MSLYLDDERDFAVYQGLNPATNIANNTNKLILDLLPNGKVTLVPASHPRALKDMRTTENVICMTNRVKNKKRLEEFLFSYPVNIYLSRRLYQHASEPALSASVLTGDGEVKSLQALFTLYKGALIAFTPTLSYGPFFDKQFEKVKKENKVILAGSNPFAEMYHLFKSRRADFLLEYPADMYLFLKESPADYRAYEVADAPRYVLGYWMCNNNAKSRAFLAVFNSLMMEIYHSDAFYDAHLKWLPESSKKQTRAYLDELIRLLTSSE
ncbi:hypothetical protein PA25_39160 [Pseudoalteromonas sp. A25]|uniref:hypothetical protein n=1 Tax=Pseudoalteromonas sp. A25 TaxID=116092 RepID=UPI001260C7CF|nr:hypothetical protein [Pseudoalteromonas sp. A25]BBN83931.1 hypothetical protein PA25_39160 [Pseudoalteromonas sp. A25]